MTARHSLLRSRAARAAAAAAVLALASPARAGGPADEATATALFQEGKALVAAGKFEQACPKFQEAHRLSPTAGTVLTLGDCLEHLGKLATAWGAFNEAELMARGHNDGDREREAGRRAALLTPKLTKLVIVVPPAARVPGFELRRDGELVGEGQWGSELPVDPGWHKIEATATGRKPWSTSVRVETMGTAAALDVPVLEVLPADTTEVVPPPAFWSGQRIAGVAVGAAGAASLVVSAIFTAQMRSKNSDSKAYCLPTDPDTCYPQGVALRNQALDASHVATGTFIGGSIAAATGLIVFLTAPRAPSPKSATARVVPVVGPGAAGIHVQGAW